MRHARTSGAHACSRVRRARIKKGRIVAAGAAVAATLVATSVIGVPAASASLSESVIVTSTGLLSPVSAVLNVGGTILTQFRIIDGVEASILTVEEPVLAALPGITVTHDATVSAQSAAESTGPHTPSDAFLQETGATRLAASGDTGQGVTVAVLDTGIDNLPDFSGRLAIDALPHSHSLLPSGPGGYGPGAVHHAAAGSCHPLSQILPVTSLSSTSGSGSRPIPGCCGTPIVPFFISKGAVMSTSK